VKVVVTAEARAFRRAVGVTAWAVLEELVLDADVDECGALVARTNVRRLAAALGVSKDTAARALNQLARAGVVTREASGRGERGALPTSSYVVNLASIAGISADGALAPIAPAPAPATRPRVAPRASVDGAQASLFDVPASAR
jgi:hypothetical protein